MPFILNLRFLLVFLATSFVLCFGLLYARDQSRLSFEELGKNLTSAMANQECDGYRTVAYFVNWVRIL